MIGHRILCLVLGYLFGLLQTGYFVGRMMKTDIRTKGSGNSGTTNALRVLGPKAGIAVFLGDFGKAFVLCVILRLFYGRILPEMALMLMLYGGFGVILGHNYPFYLGFKGGKGIAATAGILCAFFDWRILVICILAFVMPIVLTRYVSLGSLVVEGVLLILWLMWGRELSPPLSEACYREATVIMALIAALAYWRHRANIGRLLQGKENRLSFHRKKEG
ncbi:MAG: glycerol-3-phosphate 1-O-acyltransferase PlsY [Lachnospiraceae bacterium]|jgi:glycerol-3-phosphate acyltransferase PlsY|nr:glycerol-3-phosphate 1-O-acyltransferase PlsY [Lachnospiraceae bacterium]